MNEQPARAMLSHEKKRQKRDAIKFLPPWHFLPSAGLDANGCQTKPTGPQRNLQPFKTPAAQTAL